LDGQCVFMATCSPLITSELKEHLVQNNTMVFKTVHKLDMTYLEVTNIAEYHLGYTCDELTKQSWYSMIHPEDIHEAKEKHVQLIRSNHEMGSMMTVRMLRADGSSFWVNVVMHVRQASLSQNDEPMVVCINQVINAKEAYQIKVQSHLFSMYPSRAHEMWSSQLSSVAPGQDMPVGHWVQQNGNNSVPVPGYQTPMPGCMAPQGRSPLYHVQCPPGMAMTQSNKSVIGLNPGNLNATSMAQSDKLKAMLKRKIQGPPSVSCRPSKMAKMSWSMDDGNRGHGLGESHRGMSLMDSYGQVQMAVSYEGHQGQPLQVMQPTNYRIGGVLTAHREAHEVLTCRGLPAPLLKKTTLMTEQVVPDVNVPESYLTPDPSPVSSPQPSSSVPVKTEVMDPEESMTQAKSSTSILQALEKLATLTQDAKTKQVSPPQPQTKLSNSVRGDCAVSAYDRRKELPIFDAFEIDKFFDTLGIPDSRPKVTNKMKMEIKQEIKTEVDEQTCTGNIPNILNMKEEQCTVPSLCSPLSVSPTSSENHYGSSFVFSPSMSRGSSVSQESTSSPRSHCTPSSPESDRHSTSPAVASPASQEGNFPDLLSCFSEDGLDLSPLQMDPRSMILDSTVGEEMLEDHHTDSSFLKEFYTDSDHKSKDELWMSSKRLPEELSPSSSLAGEEELMEDSSAFSLAMALEGLGSDNDNCGSSLKNRAVPGVTEEIKQLDFLLGTI
jgi:PAS domain S-box-containing protein